MSEDWTTGKQKKLTILIVTNEDLGGYISEREIILVIRKRFSALKSNKR